MLKIGLTGNIGSGKSTVARIFSLLGIPVYLADEESKKFLSLDTVTGKIITCFGPKVLDPQGKIDRKSLASVVFKDARALATLNSILHPLVKQHFTEWVGLHHRSPYVIQEAAIIFESGIEKEYDHIIHVSCPKEIAIGRVRKRDGTDDEAVLERMRFQIPDQEKTALSDFVILNNGTELVIPQVLRIHRILSERSAKGNDDVSARTAYT